MFKNLFHRKPKPNSRAYRREMAERICGHHVRYITEKKGEIDEVIGREGSLAARNGELLVHSSTGTLFRCKIDEMDAWELLAKDGVTIPAPDLEHGGEKRTIVVYYVYYR